MTWKLTKSKLKPTDEDWSMSWKNGKTEIEIVKNKKKFEVWKQVEYEKGAWDGDHLGTFNKLNEAVKFAKKQITKEMKKPLYIKEPFGLPFELTEKDKFRR